KVSLMLEILSRRFFFKLNLSDHRLILTDLQGTLKRKWRYLIPAKLPIYNNVLIPNYQDFKVQDFCYSDGFECFLAIKIGRLNVMASLPTQRVSYPSNTSIKALSILRKDLLRIRGIKGLRLGFGSLTGEATGSMIGELTGLEVKIKDSVRTTGGWKSLVLSLSSFGLVIVLPGRVLEPEDEAAEESGVDEPDLGKLELDKLVLGKLKVGFDLG
nr:hypothetical protein [Tanacetum cinerariifolium]